MIIGKFDIRHGDRVTFRARNGIKTGRANGLLIFASHLVLDMGGRYGTPAVVMADRILRVSRKRAAA